MPLFNSHYFHEKTYNTQFYYVIILISTVRDSFYLWLQQLFALLWEKYVWPLISGFDKASGCWLRISVVNVYVGNHKGF